jgi:hypothetical protein
VRGVLQSKYHKRIVMPIQSLVASLADRLGYQQIIGGFVLLSFLVVAWVVPRLGDHAFGAIERLGSHLARRRALAIVSIAAVAILVRLALQWFLPFPIPISHDEFSYLLQADTFAHGRLTNPTHSMWLYFDTIHVNQQPTYMSKYPPGQGTILAVGIPFGSPWYGVVLSNGLMCAAVLWMLQGWLSPRWALLGGVLVLFRLAIFSYWMNSYWGGELPAIGGALVVGALPRILRFLRPRDALLLGVGLTILANSRPLEGLIFCLPVTATLFAWICSKKSPSLRVTLPRLVLPFCFVMVLCGAFVGYYNWRGTGNPLVFPYSVNEQTYVTTPTLFWQKARSPLHYVNPQFEAYYNGWLRKSWLADRVDSAWHTVRHMLMVLSKFAYFYMWPEFCALIFVLPCIVRDRRIRFLLAQTTLCFIGFLLVPWFQPHYAAPLVATFFALLTQMIRHLRLWRPGMRPVGIGLSRVIVLSAIIMAPFHPHSSAWGDPAPSGIEYRPRFQAQLNSMPGEHLVIVRYSDKHDVLQEWVYNRADIDHAKVVWAREIPGVDIHPLLNYFSGRHVWIAEPDASPPRLIPYSDSLPN